MKIEANPSSICPKHESRYAMLTPILDKTDKARPVVYATDGKALVVLPVTEADDDDAGPIPCEAFRDAFKCPAGSRGKIIANGTATVLGSSASYRRPDVTGPDWRNVTPKQHGVRITLDAKLLAKLQAILSTDEPEGVELYIATDARGNLDDSMPIVVRPATTNGDTQRALDGSVAFGIIMPIAGGKD